MEDNRELVVCHNLLDADHHLFNFAYGIVSAKKIEEWVWVLQMVAKCLGSLKSIIMLDRNPVTINVVAQVGTQEYHNYLLHHLAENFVKATTKHCIQERTTKQIVKEMFYRVAYIPTTGEYNVALLKLRCHKAELVDWVEDNDPKHWVASKFGKKIRKRMNNVIES